jgi:hypothetical protein
MPASLDPALRGRAGRLAAGVFACSLALTPAARAADREFTLSAAQPASWEGRAAPAGPVSFFDPVALTPCAGWIGDVCDTTLVHVDGSGTLTLKLAPLTTGTPDVDLYVYRSDALGQRGPLEAASTGASADEAVYVPAATGSYLVSAVSFATGTAGFAGSAALTPRETAVPDLDDPRGRQEALVSRPSAGAASQPVVAHDDDLLVAAYRVFPDPGTYVSQIATAVSFDGGDDWWPLGDVSPAAAANPALAFDDRGDAILVTNEGAGLTMRRWERPSLLDVLLRRTWTARAPISEPSAGAVDERPVLAAGREGAMIVCWTRTTDLGAYTRQAVLCRHSRDRGRTWAAPTQPSPAVVPGVPFGPYVGGTAVTAGRDGFTAAWVDTFDSSGLDSAWVSRSADGTSWSSPVRAATFRALPERFAGDSFRNVTLLALDGSRATLHLAYAADLGGQSDIQLVRSQDGTTWSEPVTVGAAAGDQFQPSLAVTHKRVYVSFLERTGRFVDAWLATSRDGGGSWRERRLSHDSWDPAIGAPRSATGDLLGDHQALVARGCAAVAMAADPHLANARERDRDFDQRLPRATTPQLFAWTVRACD